MQFKYMNSPYILAFAGITGLFLSFILYALPIYDLLTHNFGLPFYPLDYNGFDYVSIEETAFFSQYIRHCIYFVAKPLFWILFTVIISFAGLSIGILYRTLEYSAQHQKWMLAGFILLWFVFAEIFALAFEVKQAYSFEFAGVFPFGFFFLSLMFILPGILFLNVPDTRRGVIVSSSLYTIAALSFGNFSRLLLITPIICI